MVLRMIHVMGSDVLYTLCAAPKPLGGGGAGTGEEQGRFIALYTKLSLFFSLFFEHFF